MMATNRDFGFVRITAAVPKVTVADPKQNADEILSILGSLQDSDIVVFPELSISSYSCGDLFHQAALLNSSLAGIKRIISNMPTSEQLVFVGAPISIGSALFNCSVALNSGKILGIAPKQFIPNYNEFYERRWFAPGPVGPVRQIELLGESVPFSPQLLFTHTLPTVQTDVVVYVEVCEAIWMPVPPSSMAAIAGANILCNQSASNEVIGKADYRRNLVQDQSGRCIAAYAYTSCAPTESTGDVVFGGHALIAEGGQLLCESDRVGNGNSVKRDSYWITSDVDVARLQTDRRRTTSYSDSEKYISSQNYQRIPFGLGKSARGLLRKVDALPFVPKDLRTLDNRCAEIFAIQTSALAKRIECLGPSPKITIGVSGGLDSTLALLVAARTCDLLSLPRTTILGVTMPGFGTTDMTLTNARELMRYLRVNSHEIDIRQGSLNQFLDLHKITGYQPFNKVKLSDNPTLDLFLKRLSRVRDKSHDLVFENVQARCRTELLMNLGFVIGTGDLSELWLGWCTYNADHQSMYNVNCSIPKTLVRFLVEYVAENEFSGGVRETLLSIAGTTISPELLPTDRKGAQRTEDTVGPYELHDFFIHHIVRNGYDPAKILFMAKHAKGWSRKYSLKQLKHWLRINLERAFAQQYKRDDVPNGPKVGSVGLSPRGDWRMPSDASPDIWLDF